jgi:tetratricopeptide (TPR) repeat protein
MHDRLKSIRLVLTALLLWVNPLFFSWSFSSQSFVARAQMTQKRPAKAAQFHRLVAGTETIAPVPQATQERQAEAEQLRRTGFRQLSAYQYQGAIESFQAALEIYREIGDAFGQASSLYGLGWAYDDLGQLQKAIESYQDSLAIARGRTQRSARDSNHSASLPQIQRLEKERAVLPSEIAAIEASIAGIEAEISGLQGQLSSLDKTVAAYQSLATAGRFGRRICGRRRGGKRFCGGRFSRSQIQFQQAIIPPYWLKSITFTYTSIPSDFEGSGRGIYRVSTT